MAHTSSIPASFPARPCPRPRFRQVRLPSLVAVAADFGSLIPLTLWFVFGALSIVGEDAAAVKWLSSPFSAVMAILFVGVTFTHGLRYPSRSGRRCS